MFIRVKSAGKYQYLQIIHNYREKQKVKQKVIGSLGRLDILLESGHLDNLTHSLARFSNKLKVVDAHNSGDIKAKNVLSMGPALVFDKLWHTMQLKSIISDLLENRKFSFPVERTIFLTVLHRLFCQGSDREAEKWKEDFIINGVENLKLHHVYRAMAWLGEELSQAEQKGTTGFAPRCTKDVIEEMLFEQNRNLFSSLEFVFFDTTSIYFEGEGGETIGQFGHSKDHRSDLKQMVVGAVLDGKGRPICCELWPGNTTDVNTLLPIIKRLKERFGIESICIVADRGMISKKTIKELESSTPPIKYILGARMRNLKEIKEEVLADEKEFEEIIPERKKSKDPAPLQVKEVQLDNKRYIVCYNPEQARKDAAAREAIVLALKDKLKQGEKDLIGNKGYRKYLKSSEPGIHFIIDEEKVKEEEKFDGLWVLRTNTDFKSVEVAFKYKQLWMVEDIFRSVKSILETRPVFHKRDETIRGHVFCSFLALVLIKELMTQLEKKGLKLEWKDILRDLKKLEEVEVEFNKQTYFLRTELRGECYEILRAARIKIPSAVRR